MKRVFIIHGWGGKPNGGWLPWLMEELSKKDIFACSLPMPSSEKPIVSEWVNAIASYVGMPDRDTIFVGHSLGVAAILRYLENIPQAREIGGMILVSGFINPLEQERFVDNVEVTNTFVFPLIDTEKIHSFHIPSVVIHGKKDQLVPYEQSEKIAKALEAKLILIEDGDHFSQKKEPICRELPQALEAVLRLTSA